MRARTQYAARSLTGHSCNEGRTRRLCHIPQQNGPQEIERKALKIMLCSGAAARRGSISQWSRGPSTLSRRCARTLHVCPKNEDPTRFLAVATGSWDLGQISSTMRVDAVISTLSISVDVQGSIGHGCYSLHVGGHRSPPCCAKNFCRKR